MGLYGLTFLSSLARQNKLKLLVGTWYIDLLLEHIVRLGLLYFERLLNALEGPKQ